MARVKIDQFLSYPNHAALHVHKLELSVGDRWSFWVSYEYRIIFEIADKIIILHDIGTHDIYE